MSAPVTSTRSSKAPRPPSDGKARAPSDTSRADPLGALAQRIGRGDQPAPAFAAAVLREAIVIGLLPGGEAIRIDPVARSLDISPIPVREALRELEASRLVGFERNRGFVVAPESSLELQDAYETRLVLEPLALRLAMPDLTSRDTRRARALLEEAEQGVPLELLFSWNLRFHMALYAPCGRRHLLAFIEQAHAISHRYGYATLMARGIGVPDYILAEHLAMLEACERRDTATAVAILEAHINVALERVLANYQTLIEGRKNKG
ncbi:GntR family transcriptional regulator [Neoroseomonas lacus]|uniref:GntR family transcriptional regulator n=1 Tax=Neoroseomonas lacus TaxID=287609 RepID=A0A917KLI6_9PROT|nr:GntR family transcriptional regulator [Neoroseomonas lacus]GGJ17040.1 GntR family transcriptional regulator [Neoroseomonas lacus]